MRDMAQVGLTAETSDLQKDARRGGWHAVRVRGRWIDSPTRPAKRLLESGRPLRCGLDYMIVKDPTRT